ncbi:MAG: MBG domain-containing protein [Methylococcales bacterium]|nr:MBG domain-containing protein [Methylococcales bacterium]
MNRIHQIIWNKNLGAWIVTSELAKRGKKRGSIQRSALIVLLLLHASAGFALPTGNELIAGSANVTTPSAQQMQINQNSQQAIINWQGFSIGGNESVNIQQPNTHSALLNRVVGQDASSIQGRLSANGQVYLINPNGVLFSKTAQVDVGGLIASTHAISNQDFLNGKLHFTQNNAHGSIINQGNIKASEGGVVALIGEQVDNTGSISAPKGTTALAAGKTIDLDMKGDGLVEVKVTEAALNAQINNSGIIQADGGQVVMTAQAAGQLLNTVINNKGVVEARGLVEKNGRIVLSGGDNGVVQVSGTLDASGQSAGNSPASSGSGNTQDGSITVSGQQIHINDGAKLNADSAQIHKQGNIQLVAQQDITLDAGSKISVNNTQGDAGIIQINSKTGTTLAKGTIAAQANQSGKGGNIELLGERVGLVDQATINASGKNGGGKILVGGDYQGKNPDVHNAKAIYIGKDTSIKADAKTDGDGGKVIAWSNEATRAYGDISAKGGSQGGNGGFIETSGHWLDTAGIRVNASASKGQDGNWLLDPWDVTIANNGESGDTGGTFSSNTWTPNATGSVITPNTIINALNVGTSVNITTTGTGEEAGNITVASNISKTDGADATLNLRADNAIIINNNFDISSTSSNLDVILNADADGNGAGNIQMAAGSSISTNGGNIIMGGGTCTLSSCTLAASGYIGTSGLPDNGIVFSSSEGSGVLLDSGGGNIWLKGQGLIDPGTGPALHNGIFSVDLELNSGGGSVSLDGTGGSGTNSSTGIVLVTSNLSSQGGAMTLAGTGTGTGGSSSTGSDGIDIVFSTIDSGAGAMTLTGSGGGSGADSNSGVSIRASSINTTDTLNITGTGGSGPAPNLGIFLISTSLNAGIMNLTGTGGSDFNGGIYASGSQLTSTGAMTLTGIGGPSAAGSSNGIEIFSSNLNSGAGAMTLNGSGGGGISNNDGVFIGVDPDSFTTSSLNTTGTLNITGTGGSGGGAGIGLQAAFLNAGIMNLTGTGGSSGFSQGISATLFSTLDSTGAMTLTGTGGPSATGNTGISLDPAVLNSGAGSMILDGRGTGSAAGLNFGSGTVIGGVIESPPKDQTGPITLIADTASGADSIVMQPDTTVIQGASALTLRPLNNATSIGLKDGAGVFNLSSAELGDIRNGFTSLTIGNSAGTGLVTIGNGNVTFPGAGAGFDINILTPGAGSAGIIQQGAIKPAAGKNLVLASGGNYTNTSGATALSAPEGGRWLVYAASPSSVTKNGLTSAFRQYNTVYGDSIGEAGNGFIYASAPGQLNVNTTLTSGAASNTYGTAPTAVFGFTIGNPDIADNEDLAAVSGTATFTPTITSTTAASNYTINYLTGLSSAAGYTFAASTGLLYSVNPALLNVAAIATSKTYGDIDPPLTYNPTGFVNNESQAVLTGTLSRAAGETVAGGPYAIGQGSLSSSNYTINFTGADFIITPATLIYTADLSSRPYGAANPSFTGAVSGFVNGESLASATTGTAIFTSPANNLSNVGSYAINGSGLAAINRNYNFTQATSNATALSIRPAPLTAAIINDPTKTYDGTVTATLIPDKNYSLTGFIGGQGASITQTTGTYNSADVATANTVTAGLAAGEFAANAGTLLSNYILPTSASGNGHINKATLIATITNNPTKTYDGTVAATLIPDNNYSLTGFIVGQRARITQTAGTYNNADVAAANTVTANLAAGDFAANPGTLLSNYNLPASASGHGTITPAPLAITANDDIKIFNGLPFFGGNGVTFAGLVNNEPASVLAGSLSFEGTSQGAINAGNYTITPGGLTSGNYTITYINGQLTIGNNPFFNPSVNDNTVSLVKSATYQPPLSWTQYEPPGVSVLSAMSVKDVTEEFVGNIPQYCDDLTSTKLTLINQTVNCQPRRENKSTVVLPILKIKNSAGRVKRLQASANKEFLSLLLEDGSVRIWDFQRGKQFRIVPQDKNIMLTDVGAVDDNDELPIASKAGVETQDIIIPTFDNQFAINEPDIRHFMTSNDGTLLLVSSGANQLSLWDSKRDKKLWQSTYQRGEVHGLALTDNKRYGAMLSRQPGSYVLQPGDLQLKHLTDAVDIVDLDSGKIIKSLPNIGEQILSMQFKDNDTLQLKLASGELLDWSMATGNQKTAANFAETVTAVNSNTRNYAYVLENGTVRVGDGQGHVLLSIQNKENPFKDALLLEGDKKLLTVMANGELSLWDVASGKKMLRLFSTKQGWTVMDAFGRFDGSEEAMNNFSWTANEEDIPLDSFSENYYEPGLLSNILQNQDYLNINPDMVKDGITLPPKVVLQIAEQQQAKDDRLALQLDVFDRGGGIDKIHIYQNGRMLSNENIVAAPQSLQENNAEHRVLTLNVTPLPGKNTIKVVASNDMGIENSSAVLSFDGKTKAYASSVRLLTVGIDQYSDDKLNLNYSVNDASAVGQAIKHTSIIADSIHLYNENATKPKIMAQLKELSQGVQQDVLVIYFAGHGLVVGKEWYFLPYETRMQPTLEKIAATGISATELSEIFKDSKIQHILLMVDSCYSGAGVDAFSKLQKGQRYFTRQLSRSLGITVMTAAAKDQEAFELKSLGHGVFTYLVTQELQEKSAAQPVTAHGIADEIAKTLPIFSKKMLGSSQEPAIYAKGHDFILTDALKAREANQSDASDSNLPTIGPEQRVQ